MNYDDVLAQLRASGLVVDALQPADIGTRRRCRLADADREKRGWYHLHELATDGGLLLVGSFGAWRGNDPGSQRIELRKHALSIDQQQALRERIKHDQQREQARRRTEGERASRAAAAMWKQLSERGTCDYLARKGVDAFGVRFSPQGAMAIPLLDVHGVVHGLQLIFPKGHKRAKQLGRDKDYWPAGLVKQERFFLIGSPLAAGVMLVAEGYATGASLHQATGLPVAVAFDAGNLQHVVKALAARYRGCKILICADDDYLAKCRACHELTPSGDTSCTHCGATVTAGNAGVKGAQNAALAVEGVAWLIPSFADARPLSAKGPTDFNDLHQAEGLQAVRRQVEDRLSALAWQATSARSGPRTASSGEGDGDDRLFSITSVQQLHERFSLVYEMTETVFDHQEHKLVPLGSMRNICSSRQLHRWWMESVDKRIVRVSEVGFDPTERDVKVRCNLWGGWPTVPQAGSCERLLELGEYLCSDDPRARDTWSWVLKWLAYPIQHPGAKMKTALVLHGPQGTGKNVFFEAYMRIFGDYARVIDQEAVEDKFNDTFSRKLFIVADEVVARAELYHQKNKLKGLITGFDVRINPKNVGAYFERNHMNLVFLSNEVMPMVLERDDRRYCVIWTPPKLEADVYHKVLAEIDAGGIEALHHYLLHLDLGDFGPGTLPPMTQAKADLIEQSLDSSERFYNEWIRRELPLTVCPARTEDLYDAYRHWCGRQGVAKPAQLSTLIGALSKRPGCARERKRHYVGHSQTLTTQSTVFYPPNVDREHVIDALSDLLATFSNDVLKWKRPPGSSHSVGDDPRPSPPKEDDDERF